MLKFGIALLFAGLASVVSAAPAAAAPTLAGIAVGASQASLAAVAQGGKVTCAPQKTDELGFDLRCQFELPASTAFAGLPLAGSAEAWLAQDKVVLAMAQLMPGRDTESATVQRALQGLARQQGLHLHQREGEILLTSLTEPTGPVTDDMRAAALRSPTVWARTMGKGTVVAVGTFRTVYMMSEMTER